MARKDVAFKIRIGEELRRVFVEACRAEDRPAAQVVREFMRTYVAERQTAVPAERVSKLETTPRESKYREKPGV